MGSYWRTGWACRQRRGRCSARILACDAGSLFDRDALTYKAEFNKFSLQRGQWTDDCSMGLCMADSLILRGTYDGSDMRVRFWNWWFCSYNNAFRNDLTRTGSVGLGGSIAQSLRSITNATPPPRYEAGTEDAGNGSLMRLAPVPIFYHKDLSAAAKWSAESSFTTHPGPIAAAVCGFLGFVIAKAIGQGSAPASSAADFLDKCTKEYLEHVGLREEPTHEPDLGPNRVLWRLLHCAEPVGSKERCWNWRDPAGPFIEETLRSRGARYNGYPVSAGYWGSYSPDGLALALHCVYHTDSFIAAISKCVNCQGDTDSTGAIAGQIAGAFYGYRQIDPRCVANMEQWDDREIALRAALLFILGSEGSIPEAISSGPGKAPASTVCC